MKTAEQLRAALAHSNVAAFLRIIRAGESSQDEAAYLWLFGSTPSNPKLAESLADHPRVRTYEAFDGQFIANGKIDYTTAAGAYQITATTWDGVARRIGLLDFSPRAQDIAAVALIDGRGALDDVIAGRLKLALWKCRREWASLPDADYGQPTIALDRAVQVYRAYGGGQQPLGAAEAVADASTAIPDAAGAPSPSYPFPPSPQPAPILEPQPEQAQMAPILVAVLAELMRTLPSLIRLGGATDGAKTQSNQQIAEAVVPLVQQAVGAANPVEALQMIRSDPAAMQRADAAVKASYYDLADLFKAHELDEASREAASDRAIEFSKVTGGRWLWLLGGVLIVVVIASYTITGLVLFTDVFSDETKAMLLGQIVVQGFVIAMAFLFGSNMQNRIDATRAERRRR